MIIKDRYDRADIRQMNAVSVLNQLRQVGPLSRANIAARLGLTRATVSSIVADLLEANLIHETEYVVGSAGRPGLLLNLNPDSGSMIALDINLGQMSLVLTNVGRDTIWREMVAVDLEASAAQSLSAASALVERALKVSREHGLECLGVGVAWAGLVQRGDGELVYGPIFGWEHVSIRGDWEARFGVPVYVENEAHAGAIGAYHFGQSQGVSNLLYLSLGFGLAAGIFVDGVLLRGARGFAGQVGHTAYADNGVECSCGKKGCWVTEVGAGAFLRRLESAGVDDLPASDWLDVVLERIEGGDAAVLSALEEVAVHLGRGLASLVQTFNPELVVIGGRFGELFSFVESTVEAALRGATLPFVAEETRISFDRTEVNTSAQVGCLATVFDTTMRNPKRLKM